MWLNWNYALSSAEQIEWEIKIRKSLKISFCAVFSREIFDPLGVGGWVENKRFPQTAFLCTSRRPYRDCGLSGVRCRSDWHVFEKQFNFFLSARARFRNTTQPLINLLPVRCVIIRDHKVSRLRAIPFIITLTYFCFIFVSEVCFSKLMKIVDKSRDGGLDREWNCMWCEWGWLSEHRWKGSFTLLTMFISCEAFKQWNIF